MHAHLVKALYLLPPHKVHFGPWSVIGEQSLIEDFLVSTSAIRDLRRIGPEPLLPLRAFLVEVWHFYILLTGELRVDRCHELEPYPLLHIIEQDHIHE